MKRNFPPGGDKSADLQKEREIIEQRLSELYSSDQVRNVLKTNKATYLDHAHHVRLEPGAKHLEGFTQYASDLKYHYLLPYQALFLLESRQILIYYNELPLSIAEAYKLLLRDASEFQNYVVFSNLNRNGYFCLPHINLNPDSYPANPDRDKDTESDELIEARTKPLLHDVHFVDTTWKEIMDSLRPHGPRDHDVEEDPREDLSITFDVYKRESYTKNKPKGSKEGVPDYFVIVEDKNSTRFPSELCDESHHSNKYLFAIIDADSSLTFVQCNTLKPRDLDVNAHHWRSWYNLSQSWDRLHGSKQDFDLVIRPRLCAPRL